MQLRLQDVQRYVQSLRETHKFAESLSQSVIGRLKQRCFELDYEAHPELTQVEQPEDECEPGIETTFGNLEAFEGELTPKRIGEFEMRIDAYLEDARELLPVLLSIYGQTRSRLEGELSTHVEHKPGRQVFVDVAGNRESEVRV